MEEKDRKTTEPGGNRESNAVTRLYDRLPFSYRQVDIAVKVLIGLTAIVLVYGIITGTR